MDKSGQFGLSAPDENLGQGVISKKGKNLVTAKKLIDFIYDEKIEKISAMKIDVEGNEEKILIPFLKDAKNENLPLIIIIENNRELWKDDLIKLLEEKNYIIKKKTRMNYILQLNNSNN